MTLFRRITLPLMLPGVVAAAAIVFLVSFDEVVITLFIVGPRLTTLPVALYHYVEAHEAALALRRGTVGDNVMYFETGQGAALSAGAHGGVDQQTVEARAYAVARAFEPLLVNTVVGFIGPEYLYDGKQIIRAGLEDHFCAKLLGLPMGCDVCYTNHAEADQDDMDTLMTLLTVAGLTFLITVPGSDDVMLNYQSLSFHDMLFLRSQLKVRAAPEFEAWLEGMEMKDRMGRIRSLAPQSRRLLALDDPDPFSVPR